MVLPLSAALLIFEAVVPGFCWDTTLLGDRRPYKPEVGTAALSHNINISASSDDDVGISLNFGWVNVTITS